MPVALETRSVSVPALTGVSFPKTRAAGLWDTVKDKPPARAAEVTMGAFGWHYAHFDAGPVKLGGMTVLQLWPLAFPLLLFLLRRRARRVAAGYDPYASADFDLPRVGTGTPATDSVVLVALPIIASAWAGYALMQIEELPLLALASVVAAAVLGPWTVRDINEVRGLKNAVRASHSHPPAPLEEAP